MTPLFAGSGWLADKSCTKNADKKNKWETVRYQLWSIEMIKEGMMLLK